MGDTQSAPREGEEEAAVVVEEEEEESVLVDGVQNEENLQERPAQNNRLIIGLNGRADDPVTEVLRLCEDKAVEEVCDTSAAVVSLNNDVPARVELLRDEETLLGDMAIKEKESQDPEEAAPPNMSEKEAKLNEINNGFRRFFSNIGLKLTVKKSTGEQAEIPSGAPIDKDERKPSSVEEAKDAMKETPCQNAEQDIDLNIAEETPDNDSTTCLTMTDMTSEDIQEKAEEKNIEQITDIGKEDIDDTVVDILAMSTPVSVHETKLEKDSTLGVTSLSSPNEEEVISPIKRFFKTRIFSSLRKKNKIAEQEKEELVEEELADVGEQVDLEQTEEARKNQEHIKEEVNAVVEGELKQKELANATSDTAPTTYAPEMITNTIEGEPALKEPSTVECALQSSQEKIKAQDSPLKRLFSGSKKISKRQRSRKSSDTDSGEHVSDNLQSSTELAECQTKVSPEQSLVKVAEEEDSTWASFKKLMIPKKLLKMSYLGDEEAVISGTPEEPKPNEEEQLLDLSADETKRRTDSSVSWEALLCGSGRRRSQNTTDSENEMPRNEGQANQPDSELKPTVEMSHERDQGSPSSPEQAESPSEGDGGSTWKSLKKLVTPKRKSKDEEESRYHIPSESEINKDESSFSIKKLLPGHKMRKPAEQQDQPSSDDAERWLESEDEDSETPAVVPLSEFDTLVTEDQVQTQAVIGSHTSPAGKDHKLQQDYFSQITEPVLSCDSPLAKPKRVPDKENALENLASPDPVSSMEFDDLTEIVSKHQQLSDIPEEGVIEESVITPASIIEEAARDDTIAEYVIELTSEAVTAAEPVDFTQADETEMVSAVSQLTDSSKTSGNMTPVPAEYNVKETDALLHHVIETISVTPNAILMSSSDQMLEQIVGSASAEILETSVQQRAAILGAHQKKDAVCICIGLSGEEFDAIKKDTSTVQTECVSEVTQAISTEIVFEETTEEFNTAEIAMDEVFQVNILQPQENVQELECADESQPLVECESEVKETVPLQLASEGDIAAVSETDETNKQTNSASAVKEKIDKATEEPTQGAELARTTDKAVSSVTEESNSEADVQVQQPLEIKKGVAKEFLQNAKLEDENQIPEVVHELAVLTTVHVASVSSEASSTLVLEKEVISEDSSMPETENIFASVTDEVGNEAVVLTENTLTEKEDTITENESCNASLQDCVEHENQLEINLPEIKVKGEREDELPAVKMDVAEAEHAPAVEVITWSVKDITASMPDTAAFTTSDTTEPVIDVVVTELESQGVVESVGFLAPVVTDDVIKTASESNVTVMLRVASGLSETNHRIQVQKQKKEDTTIENETCNASLQDHVEHESQLEINLPEIKGEGEREDELPAVKMDVAEAEHAPAVEVITWSVKDITASMPDTAAFTTSDTTEPVIDVVVTELESQDVVESVGFLAPVVTGDVIKTANEGNVTVMLRVASGLSETNPRIQVQKQKEEHTTIENETCNASLQDRVEHESQLEINLPEIKGEGEREDELPAVKMDVAEAEHAPAVEVITWSVKDITASMPDTAAFTTSDTTEPVIDVVVTELESQDVVESVGFLAPVVTDDVIKTANEGNVTVMLRVASGLSETNPRIQVQKQKEEYTSIENETCNASLQDHVEHESQLEINLPEIKGEGEREDELPAVKLDVAEAEHAPAVEVITWSVKDITASMPDTAAYTTSDTTEPVIDVVVTELESQDVVESVGFLAPVVTDDVIKTASEGNVTVMLRVASGLSENNHRMQVQKQKEEYTTIENETCNASLQDHVEHESQLEINLPEIKGEGEREDELPAVKMEVAEAEHAPAVEVITWSMKDITASMPDTAAITFDTTEPLLDVVATELESQGVVESVGFLAPVVRDDVIKTASEGNVTVMLRVASGLSEAKHRIQVQKQKKEDTTIENETCNASLQDHVEHESQLEINLPEIKGEGEREDELPAVKMEVAEAEHAPAVEVITWSVKDITASMPDTAAITTSDTTEPVIDVVVTELESQGVVESVGFLAPVVTGDVIKTASEGNVAVMIHVASSHSEDNHRIQVQTKKKVDTIMENETCNASQQDYVEHESLNADVANEVHALRALQFDSGTSEANNAQVLDKHVVSKDGAAPDIENAIASITDEPQLEMNLPKFKVKGEREDELHAVNIPEVVQELAALTTVKVISVSSEASSTPVLEKEVISEDSSLPETENIIASVTDEVGNEALVLTGKTLMEKEDTLMENKSCNASLQDRVEHENQLEINLPELKVKGEREEELPAVKMEVAEAEHAAAVEVITWSVKDITASTPDTATITTSDTTEPLIDVVVTELESQEVVQSVGFLAPIVRDDVIKTAGESNVTVMLRVASGLSETNHRIQVQKQKKEDTTIENETCNASQQDHVEHESETADVATEVQALTALQFDFGTSEESSFASITDEPKLEMNLPEVKVEGEREGELPAVKVEVAEVAYAPVVEIIACSVKDITASMPDTAAITTSNTTEPLIDVVVTELESQEVVESVRVQEPVLTEDVIKTAGEGNVALHMASGLSENNHRIPMQKKKEHTTMENETYNASQQDHVEHESQTADVATEAQTLKVLQFDSGTSEENIAQMLDKDVISKDDVASDMESSFASMTGEPKLEMNLPEVKGEGESEGELPTVKMEVAEAEYAPVVEVITCSVKDIIASMPDTATIASSDTTEPLIDVMVTELDSQEIVESVGFLAPVVTDNVIETASESNVAVMIHVPSDHSEDNHRIQVQKNDMTKENETCNASQQDHVEQESQTTNVAKEEQALTALQFDSGTSEANNVHVLDNHIVSKNGAAPDMENAIASITDEPKLEMNLPEFKVEEEIDYEHPAVIIPEVVQELAALTTTNVIYVGSEASSTLVLEKEVISEDSSVPETENIIDSVIDEVENEAVVLTEKTLMEKEVTITENESCNASLQDRVEHESQLEISFPELKVEGEREHELLAVKMEVAEAEYAPAVEVITCSVKDTTALVPDTAAVTTSDTTEPLIDVVVTEVGSQEVVESVGFLAPVVTDDIIKTAGEGNVAVMVHMASVHSEDNHRIQLQLVDTDIKSAKTVIETTIEVGVSAKTERIDVCHEIDNEIEDLSATMEFEEEVADMTNDVVTQEVIQQEKESFPEVLHESVVVESGSQNESVTLAQQVATSPSAVSEPIVMTKSELFEVGLQKMTEDHTEPLSERQAEGPSDTGVESAITTEQEVSEHDTSAPLAPDSLEDVSIQEHKEDRNKTKSDLKKESDVNIIAQDSTCTFKEVAEKKLAKDAEEQRPQATSHQMVQPGTTGLVVPQNTGLISSIDNMLSPSSLSLEYKHNIQFGHPKTQAPLLSVVDRSEIKSEPPRQAEISEVSIQTTEKRNPVIETQTITCPDTLKKPELLETGTQMIEAVMQLPATERVENQKRVEVSQVAVQVTENLGLVRQMDSTEMALILSQPLPSEVASQAVETVKPVKKTESSEKVLILAQPAPSEVGDQVMATEQPVIEVTEKVLILRQMVLTDVCVQQVAAEEREEQTKEEYEQDVWLNTEESLITDEENGKSLTEAMDYLQCQTVRDQPESGVTNCELAKGESHEDAPKTGRNCEGESEGEDFDIALEHPETATETNVATMEWDAEETINTEGENGKSLTEAVNCLRSQTERDQPESGVASCELAEGESQEDVPKRGGNCEAGSESDEDFDIALEHPETVTETNVATME